MKKIISIIICIMLLFCSGCNKDINNNDKNIVVTNFCLYDFTRAIMGDSKNIKMLLPAGVEIHDYEPSFSDIAAIKDSDVFLYIGGDSDSWVERVISDIDTNKTQIVSLINSASISYNSHNEVDEHIWTSPDNAVKMIEKIKEVLVETYPNNLELYNKNAKEYIEKINSIANDTKQVVENAKHKTLVVADRFPLKYFCDYFGLEAIAAFDSCQHENDTDLLTVTQLIEAVKKENLSYIYRIELSSSSTAKTVADATNTTILELHSMQRVSKEDLQRGITYIDIMLNNKNALEVGLN